MSIGIIGNGRRRRAMIATVVGLALVAAACGDDDDSDSEATTRPHRRPRPLLPNTTTAATRTRRLPVTRRRQLRRRPPGEPPDRLRRRGRARELTLVGFTVPKAGNDAAQAAFAETPAGARASLGDRPTARPATRAAPWPAGCRPTTSTSPSSPTYPPRRRRPRRRGLERRAQQGHRHRLGRRPRRPQGQPEEHQGWDDLVEARRRASSRPNPGSSGSARWNILAAYGHVIANGGTEDDAKAYLTKFFKNTVALPGSGRDATTAFTRRHRRRAPLLRERGDPRPPERRGLRLRHPDDDAADREPGRRARRTPTPRRRRSSTSCSARPARRSSPRRASARSTATRRVGEVEGRQRPGRPVPGRRRTLLTDRRRLRRLGRRPTTSSSTRTPASSR